MLIVSGLFEIDAQDRDKAQAAAIEMAKATRAEEGCLSYSFYSDLEQPGVFRVFEEWESGEALEAHFRTPHMAALRETLSTVKILSRSVWRYEVSSKDAL